MIDIDRYNENKLLSIFNNLTGKSNPKVLFLSTYIKNYTRTETVLATMDALNITVTTVFGYKKYLKIIWSLIKLQNNHDIIYVSFRGHEILPFIKLFSQKPIIFDSFISVYDTLCFDREKFKPESFIGYLLKWYDSFLCWISSIVLVDTEAHCNYFKETFKVQNIDYLYLGCNKKLFKPLFLPKNKDFTVFWYGSVLPVQGIDVILDAAQKIFVVDKHIKFKIVGPVKNKIKLPNIEYVPWVPYEKLPVEIRKSHLCLGGHFSNINKSKRVIAGKTYQFISCGVPTIVGDNRANREVYADDDVIFINQNDPNLLSETILKIKNG